MDTDNRIELDDAPNTKVYTINFYDKKIEWVQPVDILAVDPEDALKKLETIKINGYDPNIKGLRFNCLIDELPLILRNKIIQNGFIKYKREK